MASHLARADLPAACPGAAWKTTLPRFRGGLVGAGCSRLDAGANITRRARGVNVPVDLRAALKRRSRAEATADVQADVGSAWWRAAASAARRRRSRASSTCSRTAATEGTSTPRVSGRRALGPGGQPRRARQRRGASASRSRARTDPPPPAVEGYCAWHSGTVSPADGFRAASRSSRLALRESCEGTLPHSFASRPDVGEALGLLGVGLCHRRRLPLLVRHCGSHAPARWSSSSARRAMRVPESHAVRDRVIDAGVQLAALAVVGVLRIKFGQYSHRCYASTAERYRAIARPSLDNSSLIHAS